MKRWVNRNTTSKNILGTILTIVMMLSSLVANFVVFTAVASLAAPTVLAANGLGEVTFMSIDDFPSDIDKGVITVDTEKKFVFRIHNDEPVGGNCIDEIILTFPNNWQNEIDLNQVDVTNLGAVLLSNEADDGTLSGLVFNDNSLRIVPDYSLDGVMLCPSGTTEITIHENIKSPVNPEDSTINIYTSDEDHNEPNNNPVRALISALPVVHVTDAQEAMIKYLDFITLVSGASPAEYTWTAQAKGGWGRLNELYVSASANMTVDVYVEKAGAGLQTGTDYLIAPGVGLVPGFNTISLTYSGSEDVTGQMVDGFIKDAEQGGLSRAFYIDITADAGTLTYLGHMDEDADESIDPTYSGTGYTNLPKEGTVINVEDTMKRKILVQLVELVGVTWLNVKDDNIPISYTTTLSTFVDPSPRLTDTDGQVEIRLNPGTTAGNAMVNVCFPDPSCTDEDVAIAPGAPDSCQITKGLDVEVEAGSILTLEATIYDQYGNVISNNPSTPLVTFDLLSAPGPDADLDDDINPPFTGDGDGFEQEVAQLGIADASLKTSGTIGDNVVQVTADGMDCGTTTVTGVLGQGHQVECELFDLTSQPLPANNEIRADDCFNVVLHVLDKNGNPLPKWESIVEIRLDELDLSPMNGKYIASTDLREEVFLNPEHTAVKGKLNNNDPAYANLQICGCAALGQFDVECSSNDLFDDLDTVTVVNSEPTCIDIEVEGRDDACDYGMALHTSIRDTCGNKVVDQECQEGGFASSCVALTASCGELSTDKTCVDLRNTGQAPLVDLDISDCACGDILVTAVDEADCCPSVIPDAPLPMCDFDGDEILDEPLVINKQGPATQINLEVYPKADNQDNFWVSEKAVAELTLIDECEQVVECEEKQVDVELTGEDCVDDSIQVDFPTTDDDLNVILQNFNLIIYDGYGKDFNAPDVEVIKGYSNGKYVYELFFDDSIPYSHTEFQLVMASDSSTPMWLVGWDPGVSTTQLTYKAFSGSWGPGTPVIPDGIEVTGVIGDTYFKIEVPTSLAGDYFGINAGAVKSIPGGGGESGFSRIPDAFSWSSGPWEENHVECTIEHASVHKVVIENCAPGNKTTGEKEWTDLPEKNDIVIDKFAFEFSGPQEEDVEVCIWEETELQAGFQPDGDNADLLWRCIEMDLSNDLPEVPYNDGDNDEERGAYDTLHDVYLLELNDRIQKWGNEYDNQRLGGAIVEPGDTKDFYFVIDTQGEPVECGTYDADYVYFQDYNSPDIVGWKPWNAPEPTHVRDTMDDSEQYTRRNDDYTGKDPYPVTKADTEDYGFGDRILHNLTFDMGKAFVYFRDLVAETVNVFVDTDGGLPVVFVGYPPAEADTQAEVTFLPQPATQVVARNHGDLQGDPYVCDDAGFEPSYEYDSDGDQFEHGNNNNDCFEDLLRECRPAMACSGEEYDINLQVTDGFQNQVGLATEVQLHACLTFPHFLYLGDTLLPINETKLNITVDLWDWLGLHDESSDPWDACFDMAKFKSVVMEILDHYDLASDEYVQSYFGSAEFDMFLESIFDDKTVIFRDENGDLITDTDSMGNLIVTTDSEGKARIKVTSDDSSLFQIKSFDASFRLFFVPHALDADFFDVAFAPGEPARWDVITVPSTGIPADGEQEAAILIRKLDECGNPVAVDEEVKVSLTNLQGGPTRAVISRDFNKQNNYDQEVVGNMSQWSCKLLFPWFEDCSLTVLSDEMGDVVVKAEDAVCEATQEGFCTGPEGANCEAEIYQTQEACDLVGELCDWVPGEICQESDSALLHFVGAPVQLTITEIKHSDLIPADGWKFKGRGFGPTGGKGFDDGLGFNLPPDACTPEQIRECGLYNNPDICFKDCVEYGNTGAWVTVEVQDKFGDRVTGYLGDGFKKDPGDVKGYPDNVFEKICVALDDKRAFIEDYTFGWLGLHPVHMGHDIKLYCGDLAYGKGSFKVSYKMLDRDGQPLDPRETEKVIVSVFDVCDKDKRKRFETEGGNWLQKKFDDWCQGQEYNENNLPDSETASRLEPDSGKIIFTSVPDRWDISTDKLVVAADGKDFAVIEINTENEYMDVRTSLDATVQSSLLGSKLKSEAITPGCYVEGVYDQHNPTSLNVLTEDCSGGRAQLQLSSTSPGTARVTVTGNGFGCEKYMDGFVYVDKFQKFFFPMHFGNSDFTIDHFMTWMFSYSNFGEWWSFCMGSMCMGELELPYEYYVEYFYWYWMAIHEQGIEAQMDLYTPYCMEWGVIPLTPAVVEVEFKAAWVGELELEKGWNFISVPKDLEDSDPAVVFAAIMADIDTALYFNEAGQSFPAIAGTTVAPLQGYWIKMKAPATLTISLDEWLPGEVHVPPFKSITKDMWVDVGLSELTSKTMKNALNSIDNSYSHALDWDESLQRYAASITNAPALGGEVVTGNYDMIPGEGYFLWATENDVLAGLSS